MDAPGAPTLTAATHPTSGLPGVEVYFPTLSGDVVTITVYRVADGEREAVRGMEKAPVSGDFVATDWETPFGVEASYVGEVHDAGGASLSGAAATIQIASDVIWMHDPTDPGRAVRTYLTPQDREGLLASAGSAIRRQRQTAKQFVFGQPNRPYLQNFGLGPREGMQFDSYTESQESMDALLDLLETSPIIVRTPPEFASLPRTLSVDVPAPEVRPVAQSQGGFRHIWVLRLDEVAPVAKAIIRPLVTWADWETAFAGQTWNDVMLAYSAGTWTDAVRNPPNA